MRTKFIALVLILFMSSAIAAQSTSLTATQRVENLANQEASWRWISGLTKLVVGGVVTATGYTLASARDNIFAMIILMPVGITIMVPGIIVMGWGASDLLFGSRDYENEYGKLKLAGDSGGEDQAVLFLKEKAAKDKQDRQPSFWNAFGLFSMFESPAEREYNAYLKDRELKY